jgi:hypothetical protein
MIGLGGPFEAVGVHPERREMTKTSLLDTKVYLFAANFFLSCSLDHVLAFLDHNYPQG